MFTLPVAPEDTASSSGCTMVVWYAHLWLINLVVRAPCGMVKATCSVGFPINNDKKSHKSMYCIQGESWILSFAISKLLYHRPHSFSLNLNFFVVSEFSSVTFSFTKAFNRSPSPVEFTTQNILLPPS